MAEQQPSEGRVFRASDIIEWEPHAFAGETEYTLVRKAGRRAVHARCADGAASALYYRGEIDLTRTPILEWSWFVADVPKHTDEQDKDGDDFSARIYVVNEYTVFRWRTRAVNYVWSASQPVGTDWTNPYAEQAHMVAVQSGNDTGSGQWVTERRNIRRDFEQFHDQQLDSVNALAIMTDCDNAGGHREAWYGAVRLLAE